MQTPISSFLLPPSTAISTPTAPKHATLTTTRPLPATANPAFKRKDTTRITSASDTANTSNTAGTVSSANASDKYGTSNTSYEVAEPDVPFSAKESPLQTSVNEGIVSEPATNLTALQAQAQACQSCALAESRNQVVFGRGDASADLVFIGDAPSRDEDVAGQPFVGRSGALFERMLAAIDVQYDDVYCMNAVQCRPLHSRDPKPDEFSACEHWLVSQLDLLQPRLICVLGRVAAQSLLNTEASLSELRGQQHTFHGIPVQVLDHPAYLLRSQQHKRRVWQDLLRLQSRFIALQNA